MDRRTHPPRTGVSSWPSTKPMSSFSEAEAAVTPPRFGQPNSQVGRPRREGQGRRDLPASRLHPDQGAAPRRRGSRPRPGKRAVRGAGLPQRDRHGRRAKLQGRRRHAELYKGLPGADQEPRHHRWSRAKGGSPARRPSQVGDDAYTGTDVILATGSYSRTLPGLTIDGERVIASEHALQLDRVSRLGRSCSAAA